MFKSLLKFIPITAILSFFFPDTIEKYKAYDSNKTPENAVALGESAANELAGHFQPNLVAPLAHYEELANPAIESIVVAVETPTVKSVEVAVIELGKVLGSVLGSKSTPEEIQTAALAFAGVLNKEIGA